MPITSFARNTYTSRPLPLALIGTAILTVTSCAPSLERTPQVAGRADAASVTAEAPIWKVGDTWHYRGRTFDAKDNRIYERVVREGVEAGKSVYVVDDPEYLNAVDRGSLQLIRRRNKKTGQITGAFSNHPFAFPLNLSTRISSTGIRVRDGASEPFAMTCRVVNYEDIEVHAGTFAAFRIDCETDDGFAEHWYAPAVKNLVKMQLVGKNNASTMELWDYQPAEAENAVKSP